MNSSQLLPPEVYQEFARQNPVTKYGLLSAGVLVLYDTLTSYDDEVHYMWKQKFTFVTFLYFMTRYYAFIVLVIGVLLAVDPAVTPAVHVRGLTGGTCGLGADSNSRCQKYILLEAVGSGTTLTIVPDIIIGLRVYALYQRSRVLGAFLFAYVVAELGVALWIYLTPSAHAALLPGPESITNTLTLHSCIGAASVKLSDLQVASFQFMQTIYDTIVLALIILKTIRESIGQRLTSVGGIHSLIVRHGVIYYVVMFTTNLAWAFMIIFVTENLKYTVGTIAGGLGCVCASRLTLSLRKFSHDPDTVWGDTPASGMGTWKVERRKSWIGTSTFEFSEASTDSGGNNSFQLTPRGNASRNWSKGF